MSAGAFDPATAGLARELVQRVDAWLRDQAAAVGVSVEELARTHVLDVVDSGVGVDPAGAARAYQVMRLVPRQDVAL